MTLAAAASVDNVTNATAAWVVLALLAVFAICATLYQHERISDRHGNTLAEHDEQLDTHDEQLAELAYQMPALLEWLGIEIPAPVSDDSPEAMADLEVEPAVKPDEMPTGPIEIAPETVPDGMPLAVHSALIEQRPTPAPRELMTPETAEKQRANRAAFVEEQLARFDFSGRSK